MLMASMMATARVNVEIVVQSGGGGRSGGGLKLEPTLTEFFVDTEFSKSFTHFPYIIPTWALVYREGKDDLSQFARNF